MILESLREKTGRYHSRIEKNPLLSALMTPQLKQETYIKVLEKFYGFLSPLEKKFVRECGASEFGKAVKRRLKTQLLEKDLTFFGFSDEKIRSIPLCDSLPSLETQAKQLGVLYVLEGSTLGGQFIVKALKNSLGVTAELGGGFYEGYGARTASMWAETRDIIMSFSERSSVKNEEIMAAAEECFEKLQEWFDQ